MRAETRMATARLTIFVPRLSDAAAQELRVVRLCRDYPDACVGRFEPARRTEQRAARTEARNEGVDLLALEIGEDLARCGSGVDLRIGFVLELSAQEPAELFGELAGFVQHARTLLGGW